MIAFWNLLVALPDIIKLLQEIDKAIKDAATDRKVKDDVKTIHEAFAAKDPTKLNALFAGK